MTEKKEIPLFLDDDQAWALAQLVKRITWTDIRDCAADDSEAHVMRGAVDEVARSLAYAGIAPR